MCRILSCFRFRPSNLIAALVLTTFFYLLHADSSAQGTNEEIRNSTNDPNSIRFMRMNLKAFVRNSRNETDRQIQYAAIVNLCEIHLWAALDPRYQTNNIVKGIRITAASRLTAIANRLRVRDARSSESKVANSDPSKMAYEPILQTSSDPLLFGHGITNNLHGSFTGGAGQIGNYIGGQFGGASSDNALDLIALIESTLNPNSWRTNGGTGTIRYYEPGLALVVTTTQEMHDRLQGLLWQLK